MGIMVRYIIFLILGNVVALLVGTPPPPPKLFGLNNLEPGAPLGGLAQDVGN